MLCGLPGARKTLYADKLREATMDPLKTYVVSSDDIRWTMGDYRPYQEIHVRGIIEHYVTGCLSGGVSVVVDATNLTVARRMEVRSYAIGTGARTECHYLPLTADESYARSRKWIPKADIETLYARLEPPTADEYWDSLIVVPDVTKLKF